MCSICTRYKIKINILYIFRMIPKYYHRFVMLIQ